MRGKVHCCAGKVTLFVEPNVWDAVMRVLHYSNNIRKVKSILARVIRCWKLEKTREVADIDPVATELQEAERMLLVSAMPETYTALREGKLDSLLPKKKGLIVATTGRIGEKSLSRLLGVDCLPILMPNTRAAPSNNL